MRAMLTVGFLAVATPAAPCSLAAPPPQPAALVEKTDVIVRARAAAISATPGIPSALVGTGTQVDFDVLQVIKGTLNQTSIHINGALNDRDDPNDRPVPYDFVRPGGRSGNCFALNYRKGAEYLLLLKRGQNGSRAESTELNPYWAPLSPTNEQLLKGASDPWLRWVAQQSNADQATVPSTIIERRVGIARTEEALKGAEVWPKFFDAVRPIIGRFFVDEEYQSAAASQVVVLHHEIWKARFGGSPSAVGSRIQLDGKPFTVVGVAPLGFNSPDGASFWVPRRRQ